MPPPTATLGAPAPHRIVIDDCIGCGVCETMCPSKAITHRPGAKDYFVVPHECASCGVCTIYCPTDAIVELF